MLIIRSSLRFMSDKLQFVVCCETRFHRSIDKLKFIGHLLVILGLSTVCAQAQVTLESRKLEAGKPIESKIAGGQSHNYRIALQAGQFMRVVLEQKAIGVALVLAAPDGKQVLEVNLTPAGGLESLSAEATASVARMASMRATSPCRAATASPCAVARASA